MQHKVLAATAAIGLLAGGGAAMAATPHTTGAAQAAANSVRLELTPSSPELAKCLPHADVDVTVQLTTDAIGKDSVQITAHHLAPKRAYTVFLLSKAVDPFGAAEYIGDVTTDASGNGSNKLQLIVQEAFSSTLVNGSRVRVDLNRVGMWFADPAGDDFCLGKNSPVTPFDGDNAAGVQVMNSRNAKPLPPP